MPESQPHPIRATLLGAVGGWVAVGAIYLLIVFSDPQAFTSSSTAPIGTISSARSIGPRRWRTSRNTGE